MAEQVVGYYYISHFGGEAPYLVPQRPPESRLVPLELAVSRLRIERQNISKDKSNIKKKEPPGNVLIKISLSGDKHTYFIMEGLSAIDLQIFREKSRAFLGLVKILLNKLRYEELPDNLR